MTERFVTRDSDGKTIDLKHEEAEQADEEARAKRVIGISPEGISQTLSDLKNLDSRELLELILLELIKLNKHFSLINETEIKDEDVN